MQHFTFPAGDFGESVFTDGLMFDGSSIRGFQEIHESDMLLLPDPTTACSTRSAQHKTLNMNFFVHDPLTGEPYSRDPRNIARKAEDYLRGTGIADTAYLRPRGRVLHLRRRAGSRPSQHAGYYHIDSIEGAWNTGRDEDGRQPRLQAALQGRLLPGPADRPLHRPARRRWSRDARSSAGIDVEMQHHEVGTAGQAEIDYPVRHAAARWPTS